MTKPADRLRDMDARDTPAHAEIEMRDAADLLDEAERVLGDVLDCAQSLSPEMTAAYDAARATLAKLRGEK